jgi:hypothetical protein
MHDGTRDNLEGFDMLKRIPIALVLSLGLVAVVVGDDRDNKKSKLPPMIFTGNVDGELVLVDEGSDRIVLNVKDMVQTPVQAYGPQRLFGGNTRYIMKEQIVQKSYNLSPDVAIRLMNKRPETPPKKKADAKTKKDKQAAKEMKDGEGGDKGEKGDKAQAGGGPGGGPGAGGAAEKDPNYRLGGIPGKKNQLARGQLVRLALARTQDAVNSQNYVIVVYVLADGK